MSEHDGHSKPGGNGKPSGGSAAASGTSPQLRPQPPEAKLTGDERAELERLRAENKELRAERKQAGPPGATVAGGPHSVRGHRFGWRAPVSALLIVLGCILAPVSVLAVWSANQVSNTSRYVENFAPLIHEPAVQRAVTDKVTTVVTAKLDVPGLANAAAAQLNARGNTRIAALLRTFGPSLAGAVAGFIHSQVARIVASPAVARAWTQVNQTAHAQMVKALSGQGNSAVSVSNGKVVISLGPFIDVVKKDLANRGLTIVNKLPSINPTLELFSAKYLVKAQTAYRAINRLKIVLPVLTLILLGAGIYIARRHRRALIGAGLGLAASMLVLAAGLAIGRAIYLNSVPSNVLPADAAAVLYDTLVRFIKEGLRTLLVLGLVVAAAGFFTGPSITAVRTRQGLRSATNWLRSRGESHGVSTGLVGNWTYAHRGVLRVAAIALFVLIFVFWGHPTGLVVIVLAILLLVVLGLIELIGRPPSQAVTIGPARQTEPQRADSAARLAAISGFACEL
jgi:hypothetical protein